MPENGRVALSDQGRDSHKDRMKATRPAPEKPSHPPTSKANAGKKIGWQDQVSGVPRKPSSAKYKRSLGSPGSDSAAKVGKPKARGDENRLPPLRFSQQKTAKFSKPNASTAASPGSVNPRRTTAPEAVKSTQSKTPKRNDIYAWRSAVAVPRKRVRVSSRTAKPVVPVSRIPVPSKPETVHQNEAAQRHSTPTPVPPPDPAGSGSLNVPSASFSEEAFVAPPSSPPSARLSTGFTSIQGQATDYDMEQSVNVPHEVYGDKEQMSFLRNQFLQSLGIDEISLPSLSDYIKNVNFNSVLKDRLREIKIHEMRQRIKVVRVLRYSSLYHGANDKELLCLNGWLDDLMEELWMIQSEKMQPSKVWFDQMFRWLWNRNGGRSDPTMYDSSPTDELYALHNAGPLRVLAAKKEDELFNLRDTGVELLKNGFRNKEKKMVEYWSWVRRLPVVPGACGEDIIGIYVRRLTRWDKNELAETAVQRRRMWYL